MSSMIISISNKRTLWNFIACVTATILLCAYALLCPTLAHSADSDSAQSNKHITFYSSYGYQRENRWHIPFRVWVNKTPNKVRELSARGVRKILRKAAHLEKLSEIQESLYLHRVRDFIANSKSDKRIFLQFDNDPERQMIALESRDGTFETDFNGMLAGSLSLDSKRAKQLLKLQNSEDNWLSLTVTSDQYKGRGRVQLIPSQGLTVVSDVDDTTKITGIPDGESIVLENVFFSEYQVAPCMPQMYRAFGDEAVFHYVSGGPWQLYEPIIDFLFSDSIGFPVGSVHMKNVRTNLLEKDSYKDFWKLTGVSGSATVAQKSAQIERLLHHFPQRLFVLIGDSGEHDPEIFHALGLRYPDQIVTIKIRDIVNASEQQPARLGGMTVISPDGTTCD